MSRSVKLAAAAALGGMLAAAAIVAATRTPAVPPVVQTMPDATETDRPADLDRCRMITEPDPMCNAAWAERRRRFYRHKEPK